MNGHGGPKSRRNFPDTLGDTCYENGRDRWQPSAARIYGLRKPLQDVRQTTADSGRQSLAIGGDAGIRTLDTALDRITV
jgi:hypothetical protein